jgi:hypothetical protein
LDLLKALLLPMLAIAYLTFCYVVRYRVIPVKMNGIINVSPKNIGERFPCNLTGKCSSAPSSVNQSWYDLDQYLDNRLGPLAGTRFDPGFQGKQW